MKAKIRNNYNAYRALIRADREGIVTCSSIGAGPPIADREYFRRALSTGDFSVGEYTVGRGTGIASIHFSYPIRSGGETIGVIAAALDLEWLHDRLSSRIGRGAALTVTDRNKTVLLRIPDNERFRGTTIPRQYAAIMDATGPGVVEVNGLGGKRQILGFVPIAASALNLHVGVARDLDAAFADVKAAQLRGVGLAVGGLGLALLLAWLIGDVSIRTPIGALLADIEAWKSGAPLGHPRLWPRSEIGQLGKAFEELATTITQREAELRASEANLASREAYLSFVLDRVPAGIAQTNEDCTYVFVNKGMCEILGRPKSDIVGRTFMEVTHPDDAERDEKRFKDALRERRPYTHRKRYIRPDGSTVWTENTVTHLEGNDGIVAVCLRLDERMKAEERQERLINELNHRVKNTLATVQALVLASRRSSASPEEFASSFSARLKALSASHDLLTKALWETALLADLIQAELAFYGQNRFTAAGPDIHLTPRETIGLGMIFHELATNSAKYGAFSRAEGDVDIRWQSDAGALTITWRETGTHFPDGRRRGFGMQLIENTAKDLGGSATLESTDNGLVWRITISHKVRTSADTN
jgi:PAS domain S-box-containing protein